MCNDYNECEESKILYYPSLSGMKKNIQLNKILVFKKSIFKIRDLKVLSKFIALMYTSHLNLKICGSTPAGTSRRKWAS